MKKILFAAALAGAMILTSCGGAKEGGIRMGSLSEFDSLSYAIGSSFAYSLEHDMKDIPFDFKEVDKGIQEGALGTSAIEHDKAFETMRNFLMTTRGERAQAIAAKRAEQDSIRMASGDSTAVEYPIADPAMFESEAERAELSYALGNHFGNLVSQGGVPVQLVWVCEAMQNVRDNNAKMDEDQMNQYLQYYFMVKRPAENAEASKAWLEKIAKKSGVKKTESGLLYKIEKQGDDAVKAADPRDVVKVQYTGRTREGKIFDSSIFENLPKERQEMMRKYNPEGFNEDGTQKEAKPAEFPLNRVIKGWTEGMQLVGKGGKITLWVPADLAYGEQAPSREIGPNEALEFEVEVIDVVPYVEPAPADSTAPAEAPAVTE